MSERVIKFRAWHKAEKKMYPVRTWYFDAPSHQIELEGKPVTTAFTIGEDVEIMQFTGLHDCTGKEIYEGDIMTYDAIGKDIKGIVTWIPTATGFSLLTPGKESAYFLHTSWEVIGNIYENSDLISYG